MSEKIKLNLDWRFHLGDEPGADYMGYDDSAWREVTLPHDWSVELPMKKEYSSGTGYVAGGIGWFIINMSSGVLFDYAGNINMQFMGFEGKEAGYFIIFCICAVAYLIGWCIMKLLVPRYKRIVVE